MKLTKAQHKVLAFYIDMGPTTAVYGATSTWRSLVRKGYLTRSSGPGSIETDATDAGRLALQGAEHDQ